MDNWAQGAAGRIVTEEFFGVWTASPGAAMTYLGIDRGFQPITAKGLDRQRLDPQEDSLLEWSCRGTDLRGSAPTAKTRGHPAHHQASAPTAGGQPSWSLLHPRPD